MIKEQKLGNFTYNILDDPEEIKAHILPWLKKEWKQDHKEYPDQKWTVEWLDQITKMTFELRIIDLKSINLRQDLMNYKTASYDFKKELAERVIAMEQSISEGKVIEPLIVAEHGMELMDGYARYTILNKYKQEKIYTYIGKINE